MVRIPVTNSNRKRAVRARMAATGENYTRALRAVQEARMSTTPEHGPARWPAAQADAIPYRQGAGWVMWAGAEPRAGDETRHKHVAPGGFGEYVHRHVRGAEPHDHMPAS